MKILHLTGDLNHTDGVSKYIFNLISNLKRAEADVSLMLPGGDAVQKFRNAGVGIIIEKDLNHNSRSMLTFSSAIKKVISASRSFSADIVHSHNHYCANIAYYASKLTGKKTVQTIHGLIPPHGRLKHFRADKYVSVNENIIEYLIKNKVTSSNSIRLIRPGVRFHDFKKQNGKVINIVCASRLVPEKGVDLFVKAAAIVNEKVPGKAKFTVAGGGECLNELKALNSRTNAGVDFPGPKSDIEGIFESSNIVVIPTRVRTEGLPMVIPEAAAAKNLMISSEFDSLRNFFEKGKDGLTFKMDDYEDLAGKIIFAIENHSKTQEMIRHFFEKSKKLFSFDAMVKKHVELYNECLTN